MIFRNKQEEMSYNNLEIFYNIASKHIKPLILDGGTLLGAYREKGFCEDDWDDVDLTTYISEWNKQEEMTKELLKEGFNVYHIWDFGEKTTPQISYKKDNCKIDLMFKDFKNDKSWWCVYGRNIVYKSVNAEYYKDLYDIMFGDLKFKRPKNIDNYLKTRYGNWNNPVHRKDYSCYTSDKCIKKSYEEI